jgi:DNA invertase Pin-like site-specific DNA recombinase
MKPLVIYQRVSTKDQNYEGQVDDLTKWAKENNFSIVASFGEKVSGYDPKAERTEYVKMKEYVFKNNIKDVAMWEISRLSRSMTKIKKELDEFTERKVNIFFKKENLNSLSTDTKDRFYLNMVGSVAELESDTIRERTNKGRDMAVKNGKMVFFSTYPYGYGTDENGVIKIEETEAKVVRMIFDMAIQGATLYNIAGHLNSLEIPTRLKLKGRTRKYKNGAEGQTKWTPVTVTRILKRTLYKGVRVYKDASFPVPAIVSEAIWDKAQQRFIDNVGYLNNTKHTYLFKSKIRCGKCKRMITTHLLRRKKSKDTSYYECEGYKKVNNPCNDSKITLGTAIVDDSLYEVLFNHKYIKEIMAIESAQALEKGDKLKQIDYFDSEITVLETRGKKHKRLYVDGHYTYDEFTKEITTITNQITGLKNKISVLQNEVQVLSKIDIDEIIDTYKNSDDHGMKREFVVKYVNLILMYRVDAANVKWEVPLHENEKIIYFEIFAFNFNVPIKVLITPFSKNVLVSRHFEYLKDYNMVTDISIKTN